MDEMLLSRQDRLLAEIGVNELLDLGKGFDEVLVSVQFDNEEGRNAI